MVDRRTAVPNFVDGLVTRFHAAIGPLYAPRNINDSTGKTNEQDTNRGAEDL